MLELSRAEILDRFRKSLDEGNILLGVGAGTGITAKSAEAGGADIFVIYNSGRFRMAGRGSLAGLLSYGDANQIVVEMGRRGSACCEGHPRARWRMWHRPLPRNEEVPCRA